MAITLFLKKQLLFFSFLFFSFHQAWNAARVLHVTCTFSGIFVLCKVALILSKVNAVHVESSRICNRIHTVIQWLFSVWPCMCVVFCFVLFLIKMLFLTVITVYCWFKFLKETLCIHMLLVCPWSADKLLLRKFFPVENLCRKMLSIMAYFFIAMLFKICNFPSLLFLKFSFSLYCFCG